MNTEQRIADLYHRSTENTYAEVRMAMGAALTAYMNLSMTARLDYDLDKLYGHLVAMCVSFPKCISRLNECSWLSQKARHLRRTLEDHYISESFRSFLTVLCDDEREVVVNAVLEAASNRLTIGLNVMEQMEIVFAKAA